MEMVSIDLTQNYSISKEYFNERWKKKSTGVDNNKNLNSALMIRLKQKARSSLRFYFVTYGFIKKQINKQTIKITTWYRC